MRFIQNRQSDPQCSEARVRVSHLGE